MDINLKCLKTLIGLTNIIYNYIINSDNLVIFKFQNSNVDSKNCL